VFEDGRLLIHARTLNERRPAKLRQMPSHGKSRSIVPVSAHSSPVYVMMSALTFEGAMQSTVRATVAMERVPMLMNERMAG
jgi:hypothetical protein